MRILAIRGSNLASLAGEFAIEFEEDPLARAGLFAICGPTGAGKSTLLDALCVALFDRTPRLSERGGVPVGLSEQDDADRLPANDVRGLLRRGTAEGFAEVDFLGRDQHRYRARWEVWRARRRAEGRLQQQQMSLEDLDSGKNLTGTKTETLQAIEERLGLSFEQFRRSALLAQGEFAAFLRADERMRGELLERMTGTEIYSALSRAAYERQKQENEEQARLLADVDKHAVLADEAREALEARHQEANARLAAIEADIAAWEAALAWYGRLDELGADERAARQALDQAGARWREAHPLRMELAEIEAARVYRPVVEALDRAAELCARAGDELAQATEQARVHQAAWTGAEAGCRAADQAVQAARRAHDEARPLLAEAERLDTEIVAARRTAAQAEEAWQSADLRVRAAMDERDRLRADIAELERKLDETHAWRLVHAHWEPLVMMWPRWQDALERCEGLARGRHDLDTRRTALLAEDEAARQALVRARDEHDTARDERDVARAQAETAQLEADQMSLEAVRRELDAMTARAEALRRLTAAAEAARDAERARRHYAEQAGAARTRAAEAEVKAEILASDLERGAILLGEAERALDRMRLAVELSTHRRELEPGEPCPLCGASEHPWADVPSPVADLLARERQRVTSLREDQGRRDAERAGARAQAQASLERARECALEVASAEDRLEMARQTWRDELAHLGELALLGDPADEHSLKGVGSRLHAAETELTRLRERERKALLLQESARRAHNRVATRESNLQQARDEFLLCEQRAQAARAALDECDEARRRAVDEITRVAGSFAQELGAGLEAVMARELAAGPGASEHPITWQDMLAFHAQGMREHGETLVHAWQRCDTALADMRVTIQAAQGRLEAADKLATECIAGEQMLRHKHAAQAAERDGLIAQRRAILAGRSAEDVRDELGRAMEARARLLRQAEERRQAAAEALAAAAARQEVCEQALAQRQEELQRADTAMARAVEQSGLSLDTLRRRCSVSEDWRRQRDAEIKALERELAEAHAVVNERAAQRHRHAASRKPALAADAAASLLATRREERQAASQAAGDIAYELRTDDDARSRRTRLADALARQERRARLYQSLSDLIGSADGKKFRVFAQSLTLDALLAYANRHLEDLAGRYRLVRVPGYDLDLQVIDRDMGDEVRSVNSLSGGESFLVSLALALGLSSLAARDIQVESLLIDEGFGTLDPTTLDIALSVLDALQASGRKVGLISHVPGLAERVGVRIMVQPRGGGRSAIDVTE